MEKMSRLSPQQRADLVAYLDGELDDVTLKNIEQTLAKSPAARHDVEMLVRTWDLLDELGRPSATEEFTARTLSNIQAEEQRAPWYRGSWIEVLYSDRARRGAILAGWAAGLAFVAAAGFLLTNRWIPSESRILVEELPVIENLDLYANAGSMEFLRALHSEVGSFDDQLESERK